jgi:uncharacterized phage protein (TIGR01671 family)
MREILFKAKRIDNGEWVEGNYVKKYDLSGKRHLILYVDNYVRWKCVGIDPKTLCQFTGLYDKNGKRIWENDVVWLVYDGKEHIYQIIWDNSELDFKATNGEENYGSNFEYLLCCDEIEVIGNIFDNKELLQEEHK